MNTADTVTAYKIARPDGYDRYTGRTVNYRKSIGKMVHWNDMKLYSEEVFFKKVNIASKKPSDCFFCDCYVYSGLDDNFEPGTMYSADSPYYLRYRGRRWDGIIDKIDCSMYQVEGVPVWTTEHCWGFKELRVLREINNIQNILDWNYDEAIKLVNPIRIKGKVTASEIEALKNWDIVCKSIINTGSFSNFFYISSSIRDTVNAVIGKTAVNIIFSSILNSSANKLWDSIKAKLLDSKDLMKPSLIGNPIYDSSEALCWSYLGSLFPNIKKWSDIRHKEGVYPFQSGADLWRKGFIPIFDGKSWLILSARDAQVIYKDVGS